jgi:hypothetical protein
MVYIKYCRLRIQHLKFIIVIVFLLLKHLRFVYYSAKLFTVMRSVNSLIKCVDFKQHVGSNVLKFFFQNRMSVERVKMRGKEKCGLLTSRAERMPIFNAYLHFKYLVPLP